MKAINKFPQPNFETPWYSLWRHYNEFFSGDLLFFGAQLSEYNMRINVLGLFQHWYYWVHQCILQQIVLFDYSDPFDKPRERLPDVKIVSVQSEWWHDIICWALLRNRAYYVIKQMTKS